DPFQPGSLLSLGKPGLLDALFREAGFTEVTTSRIAAPFRLPSAEDYLGFVRTSASPIMQLLGQLDAAAQDAAWAAMKDKLQAFQSPSGWAGPNELLLTHGTRPAP
ncbi:MAG: ubiquinone biosynthesis protein UbiE, partial [Rhodoferax sp.]|nr:ubiquinone biosynthesis protein UbiE [Rhodoferax sp.]